MKNQMILFTTWLNSDPRRLRAVTFALLTALAFAAAAVPGGVAFANPEASSGGG